MNTARTNYQFEQRSTTDKQQSSARNAFRRDWQRGLLEAANRAGMKPYGVTANSAVFDLAAKGRQVKNGPVISVRLNLFFFFRSFGCSWTAYFLENTDKNAELAKKQPVKKHD